ncbi:MAG: protein kinase, partial [Deltaproteobacteria bacterium]|nr:protein kinase [Deltaproteobacteria bacterium]
MQDDETLESGDPKPAVVAAPGGRIGKYEIVRAVGSGGMGSVWAARDPDLDREVAIKLLHATDASLEQRTRLLREARAMARLKHPNVLTVYEVASAGGRDFIAMELVDGVSLDEWLRTKPPAREVWDAIIAAGRGLVAAHAAGLIHRDFKPHNVLRSRDGRVLVTDFGLARGSLDPDAPVEQSAADSVLDVRMTATGALLGTPAYMAPEQFEGETDARTDQFGFCVTAWEALAGTRPYSGASLQELHEAAGSDVRARDAKLPAGVRAVLERGLAPDPAKRWPDMAALLSALERTRRTWPRRIAMVAPIVAIAGGIAAFVALRSHGAAAPPCEPEQAFGSAWTPEVRNDVLAIHPELASYAPRIDTYRTLWLQGYARACKASDRDRALACYGELRDEVALHVELLQRYKEQIVGDDDLVDVLVAGDTCDTLRISRPPFPTDQRRDPVLRFLTKAYGALGGVGGMVANFDGLRAEAKAIQWPPLEARVEEMIATEAGGFAFDEVAQPAYRRAAELAHVAGDRVTEAHARIGILNRAELAFEDQIEPRSSYDSELRDAELAVHNAGDQEVLRALLDDVRARHAAYAEGDISKAIELERGALVPVVARGDVRTLPHVIATLADLLDVRSRPGDIDAAWTQLETARKAVEASPWPSATAYLRDARYWNAWLRGDIAVAHKALDDDHNPDPLGTGTTLEGRVVDPQGHPVAGARVVVWRGEMFGDRERVFTSPVGAVTTTATDGSFHTRATGDSAIIAELGDQRSVPMLATSGVRLVLGPTRAITGTVEAGGEPLAGIEPFARIDVAPGLAWFDSIAPAPD